MKPPRPQLFRPQGQAGEALPGAEVRDGAEARRSAPLAVAKAAVAARFAEVAGIRPVPGAGPETHYYRAETDALWMEREHETQGPSHTIAAISAKIAA